MRPNLDGVVVDAQCPACGSRVRSPYVQVKTSGVFACGCGTEIPADMASVSAQAIIRLTNGEPDMPEAAPALFGAPSTDRQPRPLVPAPR